MIRLDMHAKGKDIKLYRCPRAIWCH